MEHATGRLGVQHTQHHTPHHTLHTHTRALVHRLAHAVRLTSAQTHTFTNAEIHAHTAASARTYSFHPQVTPQQKKGEGNRTEGKGRGAWEDLCVVPQWADQEGVGEEGGAGGRAEARGDEGGGQDAAATGRRGGSFSKVRGCERGMLYLTVGKRVATPSPPSPLSALPHAAV